MVALRKCFSSVYNYKEDDLYEFVSVVVTKNHCMYTTASMVCDSMKHICTFSHPHLVTASSSPTLYYLLTQNHLVSYPAHFLKMAAPVWKMVWENCVHIHGTVTCHSQNLECPIGSSEMMALCISSIDRLLQQLATEMLALVDLRHTIHMRHIYVHIYLFYF